MNVIKLLTIFILISSSAYASCIGHKTFVLAMKQQVDNTSMKGNRKKFRTYTRKASEIIQNNVNLKYLDL